MEKRELREFLETHSGYLKKSPFYLSQRFKVSPWMAEEVLKKVKEESTKDYAAKPNGFRRLFFDIETSPNLVYSWNIGRKISLTHDNLVHERAVICICYKWEGDNEVFSLTWNKGDDKQMLETFTKVLNSADEIVGHNSIQYDTKWLRTRCLYHGISMYPDYTEIDTLRLARKVFRLNSNRLDYIARYLGVGHKTETGGFDLWKEIVLNNNRESLDKMVNYCKNDVVILEKVFNKINNYVGHTTHRGVAIGKSNHSCPECGGTHSISNGQRVTATGIKKQRLQCQDCGKYFTITLKKGDE
jgi:hypothetical protein